MSTPRHVIVALAMIYALGACRHDNGVRIALANVTDADIRCVTVLAHFVTVDLPVIAAGDTYRFTLAETADGGLAIAHRDMGPMMLENLLCGLDADWSRSVATADLAATRDQDRAFTCSIDGDRLDCRLQLPTSAPCRRPPSGPDR